MRGLLDRVLAAGAGTAGMAAWTAYQDGDMARALIGVPLVLATLGLSVPWDRLRHTRYPVLTAEMLRDALNAVQPVEASTGYGYPITIPDSIALIMGTPVMWCGERADHEPHMWHYNGEQHVPAACMGHMCNEPERHIKV